MLYGIRFDRICQLSIYSDMDKRNPTKRLSREKWLQLALDLMAKEGRARLRIERLAKELNVTRGSFYWHFKDRDDFVMSVAQHWAEWSTQQAIKAVGNTEESAEKRLLALMEFVTKYDLGRYDMVMRSWALHEDHVAKVVKKVDQERLQFIRQLFSEMGFTGDELEIRAHTFAGFHSLEKGFLADVDGMKMERILKLRHAFFTRS